MSEQKSINVEMDPSLNAFCDGVKLPETKGQPLPGQEYIDRFGVELGSQYYARGLSMDEAMQEHTKFLEQENANLKARLAAGTS